MEHDYIFHLIDTTRNMLILLMRFQEVLRHVRELFLVVDAAQGIEAQTLANVYLAIDNDLEIITLINKIDLPSADPEKVKKEVEDIIGLDASDAILASAKKESELINYLKKSLQQFQHQQGIQNYHLKH